MKKITKAVIPAAGLGTRVLPATKAVPKELLPIVDKPAIQYIVEEAAASGIEDICIILSRGKTLIEDHFDHSPELEAKLNTKEKEHLYESVEKISNLANITYVRQAKPLGLGHAVLCAKPFVGDNPFAVLYGDDVIINESNPVCGQVISAYNSYGLGSVGIKTVDADMIGKYSSLEVCNVHDNLYKISNMVEKPQTPEEVLSLFSVLGRCVLPSSIFAIIEDLPRGFGGEYQLTDAMKILSQRDSMVGVDFIGTHYDMGNKLCILQAIVEMGIKHDEIGMDFKRYLKNFVQNM